MGKMSDIPLGRQFDLNSFNKFKISENKTIQQSRQRKVL